MWWAEGGLIRKVMVENPIEKTPVGRPHQRWFDAVKRDSSQINNTINIDMTTNRDQWKMIVEAAKDLNSPF